MTNPAKAVEQMSQKLIFVRFTVMVIFSAAASKANFKRPDLLVVSDQCWLKSWIAGTVLPVLWPG